MFKEAETVADELTKKLGAIKSQRDNRRIRIANFYDKIGTCLNKIIEAVESKRPIDDLVEELETYVDSFSTAVGDIIGFELTERLDESLKAAFDEENFKKLAGLKENERTEHKKTLRTTSDKFVDLWSALQ